MPKRKTRAETKSRTRDRLISAAAHVFAQHGLKATTLDEIAETAGLTKGAVYSNFESKADLALAVLERQIDRPQLAIFDRVDSNATEPDRFNQAAKLLSEGIETAWFRLELEVTTEALSSSELLTKLRSRDDTARTALADALEKEHFDGSAKHRRAELDTLAAALITVVDGVALQLLKDPARMPDELIAAILTAVVGELLPAA